MRLLSVVVVASLWLSLFPLLTFAQQKNWEGIILRRVELKSTSVQDAFVTLERQAFRSSQAPSNFTIRVYVQDTESRSISFSATNAPLGVVVDALSSAYGLVSIKTDSGPLIFEHKHTETDAVVLFEGRATEAVSNVPLDDLAIFAMFNGVPRPTRTTVSRTGYYVCVVPVPSTLRFLVAGGFHLGLRPQIPYRSITDLVVESPGHETKTIALPEGTVGLTNLKSIVLQKLPR